METVLTNPIVFILFITLFAVFVCVAVMFLLPRLVKRGIDVSGLLDKASMTVSAMDTVTDTIKTLFPATPGLNLIDKILEYANRAVASAEQMYKTSQIPEEKRKDEATALVYAFLEAAGVTVTEELKPIIDGSIEAAVFALPKTHDDVSGPAE